MTALEVTTTTPTVGLVMVTPLLAAQWLERNTRNRNLRKSRVASLAADMEAGHFTMTPDCIAFDVNGVMVNGQHRLEAVVKSGATVCMAVMTGLPPEAFDATDDTLKRTFSDVLKLRNEPNSTAVAALVTATLLWERNGSIHQSSSLSTGTSGGRALTKHELIDRYYADVDGFQKAALAGDRLQYRLGLARTWWATLAYRLASINADDWACFEHMLVTGTTIGGLSVAPGHPARELRESILRDATRSRPQFRGAAGKVYFSAIAIKAWNAFREGRTVGTLRFTLGGAKPEPFPEPI